MRFRVLSLSFKTIILECKMSQGGGGEKSRVLFELLNILFSLSLHYTANEKAHKNLQEGFRILSIIFA